MDLKNKIIFMPNNEKGNNLIAVIVLAVIFSLAGGAVGGILFKSYLADQFMLGSEIDFSRGSLSPQFIIRDPKKVVVAQDDKISETVNSSEKSVVGLFKKISGENKLKAEDYYLLKQEAGQGLIVTSDGWIITNYKIDSPLNFVVITKERKIYAIDRIISDKLTPFYFIHVNAEELPVNNFAGQRDIKRGQLVVALNWKGESFPAALLNNQDASAGQIINSSDVFISRIKLTNKLGSNFNGAPVFNLAGDIIGLSLGGDLVEPMHHFSTVLKSLQKNGAIKRPKLGINYFNLTQAAGRAYKNGALIQKSSSSPAIIKESAADSAGLKEGDIITALEDVELDQNNNLNDLIQKYLPGEEIRIVYIRNDVEKDIIVKLGE